MMNNKVNVKNTLTNLDKVIIESNLSLMLKSWVISLECLVTKG